MKTTDLMRAMEEARPGMLEAAAPSPRKGDSKPDISGVLGRIRGGSPDDGFRVPAAVTLKQTKHPRLIPALLAGCSIAACAAVVTGLAFLIQDSREPIETSSEVAVQFPDETDPPDNDPAAEPVTGQTAALHTDTRTEPVPGETGTEAVTAVKTEPVSGTSQTKPQPKSEPVSDTAGQNTAAPNPESGLQTTNTQPTRVQPNTEPPQTTPTKPVTRDALMRTRPVEFKIPEDVKGIYSFEIESNIIRISENSSFDAEKANGTVTVMLSRGGLGDDPFDLYLVNESNGKKAKVGSYLMDRHSIVTPVNADMDKAFREVGGEPEPYTPAFRSIEKYHDTPGPSFIYQWNSDQYHAFDTALHYESAAEWKNRRMMGGDWALYAEHNDGFRWLDEHADSVSYLWFMYEADGYVPEVCQMEISDQSGIWIKAALCPADVHGKVRVMIPLDEEFPAWIGDVTEQWRLELAENGERKQDVIGAHWYWRID